MDTVAVLVAPPQGLLSVHSKIVVPVVSPNTAVVGLKMLAMVPEPEVIDQVPRPTGGVAFMVVLPDETQMV